MPSLVPRIGTQESLLVAVLLVVRRCLVCVGGGMGKQYILRGENSNSKRMAVRMSEGWGRPACLEGW